MRNSRRHHSALIAYVACFDLPYRHQKPADLWAMLPTKFKLVINLETAKAARANEVIRGVACRPQRKRRRKAPSQLKTVRLGGEICSLGRLTAR